MFLLADGVVGYSASDLALASSCEFGLLRRLDAKLGRIGPLEIVDDAMTARAAALGDRHEQRLLARLREQFGPWDPAAARGVVEIERPADYDRAGLLACAEQTLAALRAGAEVVYQGAFFDGRFSGWADFLVLADDDAGACWGEPYDANPGPRYAVLDTKLARRVKVTALLQLAAYADQLMAAQVPLTDRVHLVLGDGVVSGHHLDDLLPVYRERRQRLQAIVDEHRGEDGPVTWGDERYRACLRCEVCGPEVAASRDVLLVAGLRQTQRARLREAGVTTIDALAAGEGEVTGFPPEALAVLRAQARLQVGLPTGGGRPSGVAGGVAYELHAPEVIGTLPAPDPGDVCFDFEGDPLWTDPDGQWGLEYLFGVVEAPAESGRFRAFWAHDREQERTALGDFLAYVRERRAAHPGMHIYHYAGYEKAALLRLAARHGVGEEEIDQLLRDGVLVDLYAVVRSCLRVGQPSYSLKALEPLYQDARSGAVTTAAQSVVEYATACELREAGDLAGWRRRLAEIAAYNADDCRSTLALRDWLLARAAEAGVVPGAAAEPGAAVVPGEVAEPSAVPEPGAAVVPGEVAEPGAVAEPEVALGPELGPLAGKPPAPEDSRALALLAAAVDYHRREEKPHWWAHFDRLASHPAEWVDRRDTLLVERAEVVTDWHVPPRGRVPRRRLRLIGRLEPGSTLAAGSAVCAIYDPPLPPGLTPPAGGSRAASNRVAVIEVTAEGTGLAARDVVVVEERTGVGAEHDLAPIAIAPGSPVRTDTIAAAIRAVVAEVAAQLPELPDLAVLDLLRRRPRANLPRTGDYVADLVAAVTALDGSYLAVQGPPGTGKTYIGARVIAALVGRGWRVGVVAQSHAVVTNLLREVVAAGVAPARVGKKREHDDDAPWAWLHPDRFAAFYAANRDGYVIGGTAWDFTNPRRLPDRPLDLLVIEEAGQFALADTVAVSRAARNLLLLGDPQQLPQVSQGHHPEPVDQSALGWLMAGAETLPQTHGYFLAQTWRLHPALCEVVSRMSYLRRLHAVPAAGARHLEGVPPGVACVRVPHAGNAVASQEEANAVVAEVRDVLGRRWQDPAAGVDRPLAQADVLVVAAFNAQVAAVRKALASAGLPEVRVGTVDKFQGQQAVVAILTTAASSPADVPRGMEFLLNRNRINVAISRAQWRAVVIRSEGLTDYLPSTPHALAELGAFLAL